MSNFSPQEFWDEVKQTRQQIAKACEDPASGQPHDDTCWLVSLRNRASGTTEGTVVNASIRIAGQRLTEGTHRLATPAEIQAYLDDSREKAKAIREQASTQRLSLVRNPVGG